MHTALQTISTLTHLKQLSLAGATFLPHAASGAAPYRYLGGLTAFQGLTGLVLRDIGISLPSATVLADVLPRLSFLQALDLGSNHLTLPIMHVLMPAVRQCTALRSLDLFKTLARLPWIGHMHTAGLGELATALQALVCLTSLSVGAYDRQVVYRRNATLVADGPPSVNDTSESVFDMCTVHDDCDMFCGVVAGLPELQSFRLDMPGPPGYTNSVFDGFWAMETLKLQSLWVSLPEPSLHWRSSEPPSSSLKQLTYLHFDMNIIQPTQDLFSDASEYQRFAQKADNSLQLFNELLGITSLKHLSLKLFVSCFRPYVCEENRIVAEALPSLQQLTKLELHASSINLPAFGTNAVKFLLPVVKAAAGLPRLSALHVPLNVAPCPELTQLIALLLRLQHRRREAVIRTASAVDVTIGMMVPTDGEHDAFAAYQACSPLLPCLQSVYFTGRAARRPDQEAVGRDQLVPLDPLRCLADDISKPALGQMRELCLAYDHEHPAGAVNPDTSSYTQILNSITCLSHLTRLACRGMSRVSSDPDFHGSDVELFAGFVKGVRQLRDLSNIAFELALMSEEFQVGFLRSCGCSYMPNLRVLNLMTSTGLSSACDAVVPLLAVKELSVFVIDRAAFVKFDEWSRTALRHFRRLRVLRLRGCALDVSQIDGLWEVVADLPAFQAICQERK